MCLVIATALLYEIVYQYGGVQWKGTGEQDSIECELNGGESSPGISVRTNEVHQLDGLLRASSVTTSSPVICTDEFEVMMQQSIVAIQPMM